MVLGSRAVIRRYRELGGQIITVGADAHAPDKIAYDFDKASAILAESGFKYYTVFQNRKPEFIKLQLLINFQIKIQKEAIYYGKKTSSEKA